MQDSSRTRQPEARFMGIALDFDPNRINPNDKEQCQSPEGTLYVQLPPSVRQEHWRAKAKRKMKVVADNPGADNPNSSMVKELFSMT